MGHQAVLETLKKRDRSDPKVRLQLAGKAVFEETIQLIQSERGVRIEDMLGILGATGGFSCAVGALDIYHRVGLRGIRKAWSRLRLIVAKPTILANFLTSFSGKARCPYSDSRSALRKLRADRLPRRWSVMPLPMWQEQWVRKISAFRDCRTSICRATCRSIM